MRSKRLRSKRTKGAKDTSGFLLTASCLINAKHLRFAAARYVLPAPYMYADKVGHRHLLSDALQRLRQKLGAGGQRQKQPTAGYVCMAKRNCSAIEP